LHIPPQSLPDFGAAASVRERSSHRKPVQSAAIDAHGLYRLAA
jgi:hypothetical protein